MNAKLSTFAERHPGIMEALCCPIFDTEPLKKHTQLFREPIGVNGKTSLETSMTYSSILPVPECFTIKSNPEIALIKNGSLIQITDPIWTKFELTLLINSRMYINGPLFTFAHPVSILKDFEKLNSEQKKFIRTRSLLYDIPINPLDPFHVDIYGKRNYPGISIYCGLIGIKTRAI